MIRLKRAKIELCKDAKIYRRLPPTTQPPEKFRYFEELYVGFKGAFSSRVDEFFLPCPCQKLKNNNNKKKNVERSIDLSHIQGIVIHSVDTLSNIWTNKARLSNHDTISLEWLVDVVIVNTEQ